MLGFCSVTVLSGRGPRLQSALGQRCAANPLAKRPRVPPATRHCVTAVADRTDSTLTPKAIVVEIEIAPGRTVTLETGKVARQAAGAVIVREGGTMVVCTACVDRSPIAGADFLPLRVDYAEKFSAAGRTPGSYFKREGKPSDHEVLCSRLIDRPLRPMFEDGYFKDVQLLANVVSYDTVHQGDTLAICGCAAALHVSSIPLIKPVAGVRIAVIDGEYIVNPTRAEIQRSKTELVIAGTQDAILMIEGVCDFLSEAQVLEAVAVAQPAIAKICEGIDELRLKCGRAKDPVVQTALPEEACFHLYNHADELQLAIRTDGKKPREVAMAKVRDAAFAKARDALDPAFIDSVGSQDVDALLRMKWKTFVSQRIRQDVIEIGRRPDGRKVDEVRPIFIDQGFLPCAHGSSLFTRGETQALAVATLGGEEMAQRNESLQGETAARFYLQYSFPPSSVGEVGRTGAPGRREVGHGKLAERALTGIVPSRDDFPYVIRVESSITESCGSSSMASVCGGCLAMMNAGVPILEPVGGIAMGLMWDKESDNVVILTDILGLEDALGDMDFKIAGSARGITAVQMDIKVEGITRDIMAAALEQARVGRMHILTRMTEAQPDVAESLPSSLPKVRVMQIPVRSIGDVIGQGGKTVKSIIERSGGEGVLSISIEDSGSVTFSSESETAISKAMDLVTSLTQTIGVGATLEGTVTKVLPFGAYVAVGNGKEAWLHISELENKRTRAVEDVCAVGDKVKVRVIELGRNGQLRVSRKACLVSPSGDKANSSANGA